MGDLLTFVDLFAGCGGFSLGFTEEGFENQCAVEGFRTACETYAHNVPTKLVLEADVRKVVPGDDYPPEPDVLIGGPPCEEFTVANADRRKNPTDRLWKTNAGSLTIQFVRLLKKTRPRAFVMENVPQIREGELEAELRLLFSKAGFPKIHFNDLLAEDHGTPSHRRRLFVSNLELSPPKAEAPPTVMEAIGDIVSLDADVPNHEKMEIRGKRGKRMRELDAGESVYHYKAADGRVHGHLTRLDPDKLAPTIKGLGRFVHPTEDRLLTVREHARLMGYPDDFVFHGSKNEQYNQVGESVPPPLAQALAREVKRLLA